MLNSLNIEIYPNCTSRQFTRVVIELAKLQTKAKNEGWREGYRALGCNYLKYQTFRYIVQQIND